MATALLALLSRQSPSLQTRRGLLVIGAQNEFFATDGKLPVSVPSDFWPSMRRLVPAFREFGDVIWVRSEFETDRGLNSIDDVDEAVIVGSPAAVENELDRSINERFQAAGNDVAVVVARDRDEEDEHTSPVPFKRARRSEDSNESTPTLDAIRMSTSPETPNKRVCAARPSSELFLSRTSRGEACCLPNSKGVELCKEAEDLVDYDLDMTAVTSHYSAFDSGALLLTLRSKLITELYICGCPTNSSVYATAMDAARYGLRLTLMEDCLLARDNKLHNLAIDRLCKVLEAKATTAAKAIELLKHPPPEFDDDSDECWDEYGEMSDEYDEDLENDEIASDDLSEYFTPPLHSLREPSTIDISSTPSMPFQLQDDLQSLQFSPSSTFKSLPMGTCPLQCDDGSESPGQGHKLEEDVSIHNHPTMYDLLSMGQQLAEDSPTQEATRSESDFVTYAPTEASAMDGFAKNESPESISLEDFLQQSRKSLHSTAASKHPGLNGFATIFNLDQKTVDEFEDMMMKAKTVRSRPLFGEDKEAESAGSTLSFELLPWEAADVAFDKLNNEISWQRMYHQTGEVPRLVCCQGSIAEDGSRPVYRHPSDQTLPIESWTPMVDEIRKAAEEQVGHPLNHALMQLYRGGTDYISEHSDKTLDVSKGTSIVNVSFGAERTMRLRTKRKAGAASGQEPLDRITYRVPMPHNSMIKMTLETNAEYLHGINADKRPAVELSAVQKAYDGKRISLTFRNIGTFLNHDSSQIWGQGAIGKTQEDARPVVNGNANESEKLVRAFGSENQATTIQWDATYGLGSDVLHLK